MHRTLVVSILVSVPALASAEPPTQALELELDALGEVTFARGSSRLVPRDRNRIEEIAAYQTDHPDSVLIIEGHASRAGSWNTNLRISQERTEAVRGALVRAGADPSRMVLVAHSENDAEDVEGSNRRVVIRAPGGLTELAREQRDPETGEDARVRTVVGGPACEPGQDTGTPTGPASAEPGGTTAGG
jgi:hypothetical protein